MATFEIGDLVETEKGNGKVAFFGSTKFSDDIWVGIILEEPKGKNNGTVQGVSYFSCKENHGVFMQRDKVRLRTMTPRLKQPSSASNLRPPSSIRKPSNTKTGPLDTTPSSSAEKLSMDRQKSFGTRERSFGTRGIPISQSVSAANPPKIPELVNRRLSRAQTNTMADVAKLDTSEIVPVKEIAQKLNETLPLDTSVFKSPEKPLSDSELIEVEQLRKELKNTNEKLETLKLKRKEDYEKLREYERLKIQLETLQNFKKEMTSAYTSLKKENEELRKQLEEVVPQTEENSDVSRLMEQLEMVSLDKEMAEEKAEILASDNDALQSKIQDLETELALMKNALEKDSVAAGDGNTDRENLLNLVQFKQLEQQNERYKDAILRLRDVVGRANEEIEVHKKELDNVKMERDELIEISTKLEKELEESKQSLANFVEQVEAAMGSEKMIATLTDKNLDLEDNIRALENEVSELEMFRLMDEEIIELQKDTEKNLKLDIEHHLVNISDLKRQLVEWDKRAEDYERVILKFRQKNADLNEEIQHLKDEILIFKAQQEEIRSDKDGSSFSLNTINANRTFAEIVESEVKFVELEYSRQHVLYLKSFLPDNFTKAGGDNDCVLLCVLFPRLAAKSLLLIRLLNLKYPPVPNGIRREHVTLSHKAEQWAHVKKFAYCLQSLHAILKKFDFVINNCSSERLSRLAIQQPDMTLQERHLDSYFELLRQNRLDENTSVDALERITNFYQKIFSINLTSETINSREVLQNTIKRLKEGIIWVEFNCYRLKHFLQIPEAEVTDFAKLVQTLVESLMECESLTIRALNRIPAENELMLSAELNDKTLTAIGALEKMAKVIHNTCSFAASQLTTIDVDGFSATQMKEMLHSSVEKFFGSTDSSKASLVLTENVDILKGFLLEISERLENSSMEIPPIQKNNFPPLLERAHTRKSDAVEAEGLRWQISQKEEEVVKLQKLIKARDDHISTIKLRLETTEKRIQQSGKADDAQNQQLQAQYDQLSQDFVEQKNAYEKQVETLQKLLDEMKIERKKDKERMEYFSKKSMLTNMNPSFISSNNEPGTTPTGLSANFSKEVGLLEKEFQSTLSDLKWAEQRIRILENQNAKKTLNSLEPIHAPNNVCGLYSMKCRPENNDEELELQKMLKESEFLMAESNRYLIEPLNPKEKQIHREHVAYINDKIESLKFRFHRYWNRTRPGMDYPQLLGF